MKNDSTGKVIFSLLAGATAGVVAGLLLAPETGTEARAALRRSAGKLGDDLGKLAQDALAKVKADLPEGTDEALSQAKSAANDLLNKLTGTNKSTAYEPTGADHDYDGSAADGRHSAS